MYLSLGLGVRAVQITFTDLPHNELVYETWAARVTSPAEVIGCIVVERLGMIPIIL